MEPKEARFRNPRDADEESASKDVVERLLPNSSELDLLLLSGEEFPYIIVVVSTSSLSSFEGRRGEDIIIEECIDRFVMVMESYDDY